MSRRRRLDTAFAVVLTATIGTTVVGGPDGATIKGADLGLLESVRDVAGRVAALRGQAFERLPVAVRAPGPLLRVAADIAAYESLAPSRLEARGRSWADLGLGPADAPARLVETLAGDLSGIAFDPTAGRLLVAPDTLAREDPADPDERARADTLLMSTGVRIDEPLVAHGLTHLLQHQRGRLPLVETTDAILARAAWSEGEATLVALKSLYDGMGIGDEVLALGPDPRDALSGALFPDGLDELDGAVGILVRFAYLDGFDRISRRYLDGGWDAMNDLPRGDATTRGVMHPGRDAVPAPPPAPDPPGPGFVLADRDSLGEQAIFALLSLTTGKDNLALQGADGWDGDMVWRFEPVDGPPEAGITVWRSRWLDADEAAEFGYVLLRGLDIAADGLSRSADGQTATASRGGRPIVVARRGETVEVRVGEATATTE